MLGNSAVLALVSRAAVDVEYLLIRPEAVAGRLTGGRVVSIAQGREPIFVLDAASRGQIALWGRGLGQPQSMFPDFRHSLVANDSSPVLAFASFAWQSSSPA